MNTKKIVIVSAVRTPIGSFMGGLSNISAPRLGALAIKGALEKHNISPDLIDEVFMGNVFQAGLGQAPARQAALFAGIPNQVVCTTINKVCASGMKSVIVGHQTILCGDAEIVVAGGMESMSLVPHYMYLRNSTKLGSAILKDGLQKDGLSDAYDDKTMGAHADLCAKEYNVSREDQDSFAIESYNRTAKSWENKLFDNEVIPISVTHKKETTIISKDEEYSNVILEKIPFLSPVFSKDGTVTPANASKINDGAAAMILMTEDKAKTLGLEPIAYIKGFSEIAQAPKDFPTSPAKAVQKVLEKTKLSLSQIDFFEFNEAFSVVGLVNPRILGLDSSKVNVNGGAVAMGHPLGCSGARIIVTLLNVLKQNKGKIGIAAICNGGGGASAIVIEMP